MFHKVMIFTNAAFKDREVTYVASDNIKSIGKSIGEHSEVEVEVEVSLRWRT